ncbi:hypothetical protein AJ80_04291 [Polytolypa hystricis UAMH7299]|uniref:Uncharacterized protein n=1 Tax=Polytolypa hystricis (strain UAMH7299) TaxID=1447883 RepID=A0A2B7Y4C5_POLH7|nr:hypothetical protein AJ80_04291 [Polytolypa hystricis UAMH7299]
MQKSTVDTCLILSSGTYTLSADAFDSWNDTYIFTDRCIWSSYSTTAKNLHLHTAVFTVVTPGATIKSVGEPGKDNDFETATTADGHSGYKISFSSSHWRPKLPLSFSVRGGDGANGWDGFVVSRNGGKGGDGGPGGTISLFYSDTYQLVNGAAGDWYFEKDQEKEKTKVKAWLEYCQLMIHYPQTLVASIDQLAAGYETMSASNAATELKNLTDSISDESVSFRNKIGITRAGGLYGHGGSGTPNEGPNGIDGKSGLSSISEMYDKTISQSTEILFHPDQITMSLRESENDYFLGDKDSLPRCASSLEMLIDRLSFLPSLKSTDPLYQAYQKDEGKLFVLRSGSDVPTSITSMNRTLDKAKTYLHQLSLKLDFYGHDATWVPRGSYDFYNGQLDKLLTGFKDIESNFLHYREAATTQAEKRSTIIASKATAQAAIDHAKSDIENLKGRMENAAKMIQDLPSDFKRQREALIKSINEAGSKIDQTKFHVSLPDFLQAASQFAFSPGKIMGGIQIASLITTGVTEVQDDNDVHVQKSYLVHKIVAIAASVEGLKEGLSAGSGDGTLTIDDPGATKLVMEENGLMALVNQYRGLLGDADVKNIKDRFDKYISTILLRNNNVIRYNSALALLLQSRQVVATQKQQLALINRKAVKDIDPDLPVLAVFIEQAFFDTAAQVLQTLYLTQRALAFWTLQPPVSNLYTLRQGGFIRPLDQSPSLYSSLVSARDATLTAYANALENSSDQTQKFGEEIPLKLELSSDEISDLQTGAYITIPPADSTTTSDDSPFADYAEVRLSRVRFYVKGATTTNDLLHVTLEHMGDEMFIDVNDGKHIFIHNALHFKFVYHLKTGAIQVDGDMKGVVKDELALPGPFAQWRVMVNDSYNQGLDMSGVSKAWFEFAGWSKSFG